MFDLPEPYGALVRGVLLTAAAVIWTILLARIVGLRSFSKMTAFDFVTTIATGSLIATAATRSDLSEYIQSLTAIGGVFLVQWLLAKARLSSDVFQSLIRNKPILLMKDGEFIDAAMAATRVSRSSIMEKLRAANVSSTSQVKAVVLETTGNISVMQREDFDEGLLEGVERMNEPDPR